MAMRCPNCSNEISLEEAFCGQCGTPVILSVKPTEMVNAPPNRHGLLSSGYNNLPPPLSDTYRSGMLPPPDNRPPEMSPGSQQQSGFYQDPTQAMTVLPPNQVQSYPTVHPQQTYASSPLPGGY